MKSLLSVCLAAVLSVSSGFAEGDAIQRFHLNEKMEKEVGYCQAVRAGNVLYVSGSVGAGEMSGAIKQAMEELTATLKAHGLTFKDVVKENVYATDLDAFIQNAGVRRAYYGETFPAATWVGVKRLYMPDHVVEIEVIAVGPEIKK